MRYDGAAMGKAKHKKKKGKRKQVKLTAATADIHDLYQRSVQDPPTDIAFVDKVFKKRHKRLPKVLREDFCGTALMCADWVRGKKDRKAVGIDLDQPTLDWGIEHNIAPLNSDARRVTLVRQNVLDPAPVKSDVTVAFNFSYCVFKERKELVRYCQGVREGLKRGGGFFLDIHGGVETTVNMSEETEHKTKDGGFTYIWDQDPYDAINGYGLRHIHFAFKDGSEINRAFTYDWRMWTLPELRDVLYEAGFKEVEVYWEGAEEDGTGNGVFTKTASAEQEDSWIAYVVAWK